MATRSFIACAVLGGVLVATACASNDESRDGFDGSSSSSGNTSSSGSIVPTTDGGGVGEEVLEGCATDTAKATPSPLDLYILFDSSSSMEFLAAPGVTKMKATVDATTSFINDPSSAGISVALTFFPAHPPGAAFSCQNSSQCGASGVCTNKMCAQSELVFCATDADCGGAVDSCKPAGRCTNNALRYCYILGQACPNNEGTCDAQTAPTCIAKDQCADANYATPVVPFTPLPQGAITVATALTSKVPFGSTPTSAGLAAAEKQAYEHALNNAGHTVAIMIVTDGVPTICNPDIDAVASLAKIGFEATPSIKTFVIGVFAANEQAAAQTNLDKIAGSGGTNKALIVGVNASTKNDLIAAMNQVRGKALPCDYKLPSPEGGIPDYAKVNVRHTSGTGTKTVYPKVANAGACGTGGGWYFDTEPTPTSPPGKVILCPATCSEANTAGGQVDVVLGCQTVVR